MKIICLGDSLTFGYGVSRKYCWTSLIENRLGIEVINKGINGDTTGGMLARFGRDVLTAQPDILLLMGGGNDLFTSGTCQNAQSNMAALAQQAMASCIRPVFLISPPWEPTSLSEDWRCFVDTPAMLPKAQSYRKWLLNYASLFHISVIDFYDYFMNEISVSERLSCYLDGLHMNQKGHSHMADLCQEFLLNSISS